MHDMIRLLKRGGSGTVFYLIGDAEAAEHVKADAALACVTVSDWNRELSPWKAEKCFRNTCAAGYFSSDRTIEEYCNDIWKITKEG